MWRRRRGKTRRREHALATPAPGDSPMNEPLLKRFALAMLVAMTVALAMGLQAWGPMQLSTAKS